MNETFDTYAHVEQVGIDLVANFEKARQGTTPQLALIVHGLGARVIDARMPFWRGIMDGDTQSVVRSGGHPRGES